MTAQDFWQQAFLAILKDGGGTATATNYADIAKDEFEKRFGAKGSPVSAKAIVNK